MKKIFSMALALIMVMSLSTVAFAEGTTSVCKITTPDNGHTYEAYQLFTGDLHDHILSNIVWGNGISIEGQNAIEMLYAGEDASGPLTAAQVAAMLVTESDAKVFADNVAPYLTNAINLEAGTSTAVNAGYYLVKDVEIPTGHHAATRYIIHVVGDVELNPKTSVPTVDKMQSYEKGKDYVHDPLDVNIGDVVYYKLTGTLPLTLDDYTTYKYIFHDTLSDGLTFKNDVVVEINGTDVTKSFVVENKDNELTVSINDIKAIEGVDVTKDSTVTVYYSATLNNKAVIGNPGNPNEVYLEFSNDPNYKGEGEAHTGKTPPVKVVVFTFQINVNKQDNDDKNIVLKDAKFVLMNADKTKYVQLDLEKKVVGWTDNKDNATVIVSDEKGNFNFIGLDAGTYYLEETQAPAGYNKLAAPVAITITASYTNNELNSLKANVGTVQLLGNVTDGSISIVVRNSKGTSLPSTGGMGTTLFYVLGSVLMIGAAVILITKKRMSRK